MTVAQRNYAEQMAEGVRQADSFVSRVESHAPIPAGELAREFELARTSSLARAHAFAGRVQQVLIERCRGA